jgi:hypothetical protein
VQDAEFVSFRISQNVPRSPGIHVVGQARATPERSRHGGYKIDGPQIEVQPVLGILCLWYAEEKQLDHSRSQADVPIGISPEFAPHELLPPRGQPGRVGGVDADTLDPWLERGKSGSLHSSILLSR